MTTEPAEDVISQLDADETILLSRFLVLIRDNYRKADKAMFFMERRAGVTNASAVYNVRDVLSHFATFLDSKTSAENRRDQLANAEEHLRRAIIEPYELGLADLTKRLEPLYEKYKARLLPVKDRHTALGAAQNQVQVDAALREINELIQKGKRAKSNNRWDKDWEEGVQAYEEAYEQLAKLNSHMETQLFVFEQIEREFARDVERASQNKKQTLLTWWGIVATILSCILAIAVSYLLRTR
jgi:hypothetical protein